VLFLFGLGPARYAGPPEGRARGLLAALDGELERVRWARQVHGGHLVTVDDGASEGDVECVGEGDGLLTMTRRTGLLVWTADCVPILLAGGGAVAAVHAGWRGAAAGIATAAVRELQRLAGVPAGRVRAVLGPAVGSCHYPVGPEVVTALAVRGVPRDRWLAGDRVDLRAFLVAELEQAGVARVERVGGCVFCALGMASFRRDGTAAGRQLSLAVKLD